MSTRPSLCAATCALLIFACAGAPTSRQTPAKVTEVAPPESQDPVVDAMAAELPAGYPFYLRGKAADLEHADVLLSSALLLSGGSPAAPVAAIAKEIRHLRLALKHLDLSRPWSAALHGFDASLVLERYRVGLPSQRKHTAAAYHYRFVLPSARPDRLHDEVLTWLEGKRIGGVLLLRRLRLEVGYLVVDLVAPISSSAKAKVWLAAYPERPLLAVGHNGTPAQVAFREAQSAAVYVDTRVARSIMAHISHRVIHRVLASAPDEMQVGLFQGAMSLAIQADSMFDPSAYEVRDMAASLLRVPLRIRATALSAPTERAAFWQIDSTISLTRAGQQVYPEMFRPMAMPGMLAEPAMVEWSFLGDEVDLKAARVPAWLRELVATDRPLDDVIEYYTRAGTTAQVATMLNPMGSLAGILQTPPFQSQSITGDTVRAIALRVYAPGPSGVGGLPRVALSLSGAPGSGPALETLLEQHLRPMASKLGLRWDVVIWQGHPLVRLSVGMPLAKAFPSSAPTLMLDASQPIVLRPEILGTAREKATTISTTLFSGILSSVPEIRFVASRFSDHRRGRLTIGAPKTVQAPPRVTHTWKAEPTDPTMAACRVQIQYAAWQALSLSSSLPPDMRPMMAAKKEDWQNTSKCADGFTQLQPPSFEELMGVLAN